MLRLVIQTLESPFGDKGYSSYPNGGGHGSVRALQASVLKPRRPSKQQGSHVIQPEQAVKLSNGVLIRKFHSDLQQWFDHQRVTLEHHPF